MPVNSWRPGHPWKLLRSQMKSGANGSAGTCCVPPNADSIPRTTSTFSCDIAAQYLRSGGALALSASAPAFAWVGYPVRSPDSAVGWSDGRFAGEGFVGVGD